MHYGLANTGDSESGDDVGTSDCLDDGQQYCPDEQSTLQFRYRLALLKFKARRWKHQAVLQVERCSWQRQFVWALAVLPTLFGARKLAALKAVQVGLHRWFAPDFENEENNEKMKMKELNALTRGNNKCWSRSGLGS